MSGVGTRDHVAFADRAVGKSMATILVVDDDPVVQAMMGDLLREAGHEVLVTDGWEGVLEHLSDHVVQLLLLDVNLPLLNGDRIAEFVRKHTGLTPVILYYSSLPEETLEELAARTGAQGFLRKGCDPVQVVRTVDDLLQR